METFFDSHVHFNGAAEPGYTVSEQLERAAIVGVQQLVAVGGSCDLNAAAFKAAAFAPERVRAAVGFDRDQQAEMITANTICDATERLERVTKSAHALGVTVCAIGEIGLDYHYSPETRARQMALFDAQCALAVSLALPVIVHSRDADDDTLMILKKYAGKEGRGLQGVLHCFTGSCAFAETLVQLGFYISFSGIVTFRNADALREVAKVLPESHLLVETDAPYLAPVPYRGKRNEPAYVREVVKILAAVRNAPVEAIAARTTSNARALFQFPAA